MEKVFITMLQEDLYLLDDNHEATGYLLIGKDKALVIDTMNGNENLYEGLREITDKPFMVVNTHGHPDHIAGNMYFQEAYMNIKDVELAHSFIDDEFKKFMTEHGTTMPSWKDIHEGDVIDLGGKTIKVYDIPGHTKGGILLLDVEDRILFTGDSVNHHLWMQLDHSLSLAETVKNLDRIMFLEKEADKILHGHAQAFDDISLLRKMRNGMQEVVDGKTENDKPYNWFGGCDLFHEYETGEVICYKKVSTEPVKKSL